MIFNNIKRLCEQQGITITELERSVGLASYTIGKWRNVSPTIGNLKAVADFFGVTVDELIREEAVNDA